MGTCCLYGFKKENKFKMTFNPMDSYPSGFGKDIVLFIRENTLNELNDICDKIVLVNGLDYPNDEQIKELIEKHMVYERNKKILNWQDIFWLNDSILEYYKNDFYIMPSWNERMDGLDDYLYLIDLDDNKFKIYQFGGNNKKENPIENYKFTAEYPLSNIPRNWEKEI